MDILPCAWRIYFLAIILYPTQTPHPLRSSLPLSLNTYAGPWSYRICSLVIMTPMYAAMLVMVGTIFGRHAYFRHFSVKMFSRFGVPPELMDKNFHTTSKNFKKW